MSDNLIKAIDQLGSDKVHVQVGGVVGLGRLLRTANAKGDYWPIMDVLTAFVRQSVPKTVPPRAAKPSEAVQAAIDVLARRSQPEIPDRTEDNNSPVDLVRCDLRHLWMAKGHYEAAQFGDSLFGDTDLRDAFFNNANFDRAELLSAKFDCADLTGAQFDSAKMNGVKIRWVESARKASFENADLTGADFEGTNLTEVSLQGAILFKADFSKAKAVDPAELKKAHGDRTTLLPPECSRPSTWP